MKKFLLTGIIGIFIAGFLFFSASPVRASSEAIDISLPHGSFLKDTPCEKAGPQPAVSLTASGQGLVSPAAPVLPQGPNTASATQAAVQAAQVPLQAESAVGNSLPLKTETVTLISGYLNGTARIVQVYLPGDYEQNPDRQYPVLYALDGQQLPQIHFGQTLSDLFSTGEVAPFITVAVFSTDGDTRREELGTGPTLNLFGWGRQSEAFNLFLVNELVPKINATYRILPGAQNSAVMGWSLGGLASFYLAWEYPDTFGIAGAFSPSFWWRTASQPGDELQARVIPNLVRDSPARLGLKLWFEAGTKELPYSDVDGNGVIDMIQDVQDVISLLGQKGYQAGTDLSYVQVEGGQHELSTWETVLPDFLRFAFPGL